MHISQVVCRFSWDVRNRKDFTVAVVVIQSCIIMLPKTIGDLVSAFGKCVIFDKI